MIFEQCQMLEGTQTQWGNFKWYLGHMGVWHVAVTFLQKHRNVLQCSLVRSLTKTQWSTAMSVPQRLVALDFSNRVESVSSEQSFSNFTFQIV